MTKGGAGEGAQHQRGGNIWVWQGVLSNIGDLCNVGTHWQSLARLWTHWQSCAMPQTYWWSCPMSGTNQQCSNLIVVKKNCCNCPSEKAFLKFLIKRYRTLFSCFAKKIHSRDWNHGQTCFFPVDALPQETLGYILEGFTQCSVVEFRDIHKLLTTTNKVGQMQAVSVKRDGTTSLAAVQKLCT